ncbi:PAS domain S-box protein [Brevibacillus agri]|uniref:PAS domain S-box protein n=1 Tax=Brevibacillus agri TaxID=51101 RepID=UPI0025B70C45|nr:PAS domain S-box protein [Brevibacillus agri]MDN4092267.1 PAS domain S-box protein [Brevibacillus agri]
MLRAQGVEAGVLSPKEEWFHIIQNVHNHIFTFFRNEQDEFVLDLSKGKLAYEFGVDTEKLKGMRAEDILRQYGIESIMPYYQLAFAGQTIEYELAFGERYFSSVLTPICRNGIVTEIIGSATEITEYKQMKQQMQEAEELYRSLVEDTLVGVYIAYVDEPGFVYVNPRLGDIFGYSQEELVKMTASDLVIEEERDIVRTHQERRINGDRSNIHYQFRGLCKNGNRIDVEVLQKTSTYKQKPAVIGIVQDITERKQAEELVRKSELLSVIGQMAAGVAHEIRNPLTSLKGFVQLLRAHSGGKDEYYRIMLSELDRIEFIISEFLELAKPQVVFQRKREMQPLLEQIVMIADTHAIMHNVQILTSYADNLPGIVCEENQLKQVFLNLLKNAVEAMPNGGVVTVSASVEDGMMLIAFTDQGCGIAEEQLLKLGEPFFTTKPNGTGLGLMVSYKIIANHGGTISVCSKEETGTTFEIRLPVR